MVIGLLGVISLLIVKKSLTRDGQKALFLRNDKYAHRWGTLYDTLAENRVFFVIPFLLLVIIRSAVVAFGQSSGLGQTIALIVVESGTFVRE